MGVVGARKVQAISAAADQKIAIQEAVGDLSGMEIFHNLMLVGTYIRPEKIGSILRPNMNVDEDQWQSKVGLVLKMGPDCFQYEDGVEGQKVEIGDWIVFRIGDANEIVINDTPCKIIQDRAVRLRIADPKLVTF